MPSTSANLNQLGQLKTTRRFEMSLKDGLECYSNLIAYGDAEGDRLIGILFMASLVSAAYLEGEINYDN